MCRNGLRRYTLSSVRCVRRRHIRCHRQRVCRQAGIVNDIPQGPPLKEWMTRPRRDFKSVGQSSQFHVLAAPVSWPFFVSSASVARRIVES